MYFEIPSLESLNLGATVPALSVAIWACIVLLIDLWVPPGRKSITAWLTAGNLVFAFIVNLLTFNNGQTAFLGMYLADPFSGFMNVVILITAFIAVLLSLDYTKRTGIEKGEYYVLLLFTTAGTMFMSSANDLIAIFIALELLSIPLYIMSAFRAPELKSEEAGMKYFVLGAFSSAFYVFGAAMIYGATGETNLPAIFASVQEVLTSGSSAVLYLLVGVGLLIVGLGFKVAVVPFHMWTPDVYQGAPTPVTALMSVSAKAGGFGALLRIMVIGLPSFILLDGTITTAWQTVVALIAALTVILGNFVAVAQTDIKRLLAYSSISHAGYILMAIAAAGTQGVENNATQAALVYILSYMFTNLGAFAVAIAVEKNDGTGTRLDDFIGLGRTKPMLAFAMAVFMLSLTGIPLTAGFIGKAFVFNAALQANLTWMVVIGVLTSVISAFYYVRIIVNMYLRERPDGSGDPADGATDSVSWAVYASFAGTLLLGIVPALVTTLSDRVILAMTP